MHNHHVILKENWCHILELVENEIKLNEKKKKNHVLEREIKIVKEERMMIEEDYSIESSTVNVLEQLMHLLNEEHCYV